jgi:hypothetical protein
MSIISVTTKDIEAIFGEPVSARLARRIQDFDLRYEEISEKERDERILEVVRTLQKPDLKEAGEHRIDDWERGWGENLDALFKTGNIDSLVPLYFGKHPLVRWMRRWVKPLTKDFDYKILSILVEHVMEMCMADKKAVYEFGCGPGYHLLQARKINAKAKLVGLDWTLASQKILNGVAKRLLDTNIQGRHFNFYQPDETLDFEPDSVIYTVAALEQVGDRHEAFIDFLLRKKPSLCVHFEPIDEIMEPNDLMDQLSVLYCRKRNYLRGFLPRLEELEKQGCLKILRKQRLFSGSFFLEGHTLIVWSPRP